MISQPVFAQGWAMLLRRWRKRIDRDGHETVPFDDVEAEDYRAFLSPLMDDAEFEAACWALWAGREFFPRPADFLSVRASGEWAAVLGCMDRAEKKIAWSEEWQALSLRARTSCEALGGIHAMLALRDRDILRLRVAWLDEYERQVQAVALLAPMGQKRLSSQQRKISAGG